jgi:protein CpxP
MKKTTILIVLMIFAFGQIIAQKGAAKEVTIEQRAENQAQKLNKQLLLSPEQYTKVHELVLAHLKQIDYLKKEMKNKQGEESQNYRKNTLRKLRLGFEQEMKSVLNPQQFEKWEKIRAKKVKTVKENTKDKKKAKTEIVETEDIF